MTLVGKRTKESSKGCRKKRKAARNMFIEAARGEVE